MMETEVQIAAAGRSIALLPKTKPHKMIKEHDEQSIFHRQLPSLFIGLPAGLPRAFASVYSGGRGS